MLNLAVNLTARFVVSMIKIVLAHVKSLFEFSLKRYMEKDGTNKSSKYQEKMLLCCIESFKIHIFQNKCNKRDL